MKTIFLQEDGVIQMYLNSTLFIDICDSIEPNITNLYTSLSNFNIYSKKQKKTLTNINNIKNTSLLRLKLNKIANSLSPENSRYDRSNSEKKNIITSSKKLNTLSSPKKNKKKYIYI